MYIMLYNALHLVGFLAASAHNVAELQGIWPDDDSRASHRNVLPAFEYDKYKLRCQQDLGFPFQELHNNC